MTTYAIHLPDGGTSEFTNYAFNSVVELGGKRYALKADGLYELGGDSDAGDEIAARVAPGYSAPGNRDQHPDVFLAVDSPEAMNVAVVTDEGVFDYDARPNLDSMSEQIAELGLGIRENRLYLIVRNTVGAAFSLFDIAVKRVKNGRRI